MSAPPVNWRAITPEILALMYQRERIKAKLARVEKRIFALLSTINSQRSTSDE